MQNTIQSSDSVSVSETRLRILYVGTIVKGSTSLQRAQSLEDLGHYVIQLSSDNQKEILVSPTLIFRVRRKLIGPEDFVGVNAAIRQAVRSEAFDVLWIDKGLTIESSTLREVHKLQPECRIVGYSPDDMLNRANQSRQFLDGLPEYDHFITTKSYNVAELKELGCPDVSFVDNTYDPHTHRPVVLTEEERRRLGGAVGFIGQWESARAESLRKLALAGIEVRVWGFTWERMKDVPLGLVLENRPLWADDYAQALCAFNINLCFLRKCNRDLQTSRTMEIPACGAFMLAERTVEHQRLFTEGLEAEFFADDAEMVRKVRHYIEHPEERQLIARAGYERCLRDGYNNAAGLGGVLNAIISSKPSRAFTDSGSPVRIASESANVIPGKLTGLKVLYVGPMQIGSTAAQRAEALKDLGHQVKILGTQIENEFVVFPSLLSRTKRRLLGARDSAGVNHSILSAARSEKFDILWIDKGLTVEPATLREIHKLQPKCRIVGYSPDDMINPANQSRKFLKGLPVYDHFITTKSYNVPELMELGCLDVVFVDKSYDPHTHRPMLLDEDERQRLGGSVGFIGQWEHERAESLRSLALAGIPVRVWGFTWERMKDPPPGLILENKPLWGDDYARALSAFDINLCFLRKCNRDLQTSRTMEIPASCRFMLAERTEEHMRLFEEGAEVEYFGNDDELIRKVRYYLRHPEERQRIARNGYERCLRDGYSNAARLGKALEKILASEPRGKRVK